MTPEQGNGWWPSIGPDGRIVCGLTEVFLGLPNAWQSLGPGLAPIWLEPTAVPAKVLLNDNDQSVIVTVSTGHRETVVSADHLSSAAVSEVGRWFGNQMPGKHNEYQGATLIKEYGSAREFASISFDGTRVLHVDRPYEDVKTLWLNETEAIAVDKKIASPQVTNDALLWQEYAPDGLITYGLRKGQSPDQKEVWGVPGLTWEGPVLFDGPDGPWVASINAEDVLHVRPAGSAMGYILTNSDFRGIKARFVDGQIIIASSTNAGVIRVSTIDPASERVDLTFVPPPPPPPEEPIGPRSEPLPVGTLVDVASFVGGLNHFPRGVQAKGDSHGMDLQRVPGRERDGSTVLWFAKFWEIGPESAELGELVWIDAHPDGNIHLLADCTAGKIEDKPVVDIGSKTTFLRKQMRIGRQFGYDSGPMLLHKYRRDGTPIDTRDFSHENWVEAVYPQFWFGADIGMQVALVTVHNNTGVKDGQTTDVAGLHTETRIWALGSSWVSWIYDEARVAFATGHFVLPATHVQQSDFFRVGGTRYPPEIPAFIPIMPTETLAMPESIPPAVQVTMHAMASMFPLPQGNPEAVKVFSRRVAEQVKFSHATPDEDWGLKSTTSTSPVSNNITRKRGAKIDTWDWINGSAGMTPSLNIAGAEHFDVSAKPDGTPAQHFIPVTAVNHLGDQKPRPGRAPWPAAVRHGVSGFDVAARLHGNDASYYNVTHPLPLNCFVYTTIDHPQTHRLGRTFAEGLVQTETLLKRLTADNRQAMFIMVCGPHTANNGPKPTRAEILDMVKQQVALFSRYPKAVLALSLGNELYQGFEPPELLDPTLWAEVDALVPLEFPFCVGQVSEAVVFGPGSFAAMHPDRGKSSADALQILADTQVHDGRTVVAREPKRIEAGNFAPTDQASGDLNFVKEELANAKRLNLPYFLHLAAGRGCHVPAMDQVQHDALALLKAEAAVVTPPGPPVPPITPPGSGHPILDCNLSEGAGPNHFSHRGYELFVLNKPALVAEAHAWFIRGKGQPMPKEQEAFFVDIRCNRECHVWITPRRAWTDALPGGAP